MPLPRPKYLSQSQRNYISELILKFKKTEEKVPIPVATWSKALVATAQARFSPGSWMSVCCECCVLSGRDLWDRPKIHVESYRVWCVLLRVI